MRTLPGSGHDGGWTTEHLRSGGKIREDAGCRDDAKRGWRDMNHDDAVACCTCHTHTPVTDFMRK